MGLLIWLIAVALGVSAAVVILRRFRGEDAEWHQL